MSAPLIPEAEDINSFGSPEGQMGTGISILASSGIRILAAKDIERVRIFRDATLSSAFEGQAD
jgi:hypothetical protein